MKTVTIARTLVFLAAAVVMAALPGCNIIGAGYVLVKGPEKTPAQFTLPKDRPTVVFVDDIGNVLMRRTMRTDIARAAQQALLSERVLTNVVDATAPMQVVQRESAGQPLDISTLGRAVEAEIVVYVQMDAFTLSSDGQTFSPQARAHVKVIDAVAKKRLWPEDVEGRPITVTMRVSSSTVPRSATERITALNALAERTGLAVAQLFYEHEARESIRQGH
jgi:hypothetical protein